MHGRRAFAAGRGLAVAILAGVLAAGVAWVASHVGASEGGKASSNGTADPVSDPAGKAVTTLAAKDASAKGKWQVVPNAMAGGGAYLSAGPDGVGSSLEFPIEVDQPTQIAVTPLWFVNGDQRKATRFPGSVPSFHVQQAWPMDAGVWEYPKAEVYPAAIGSKPGPDAIDIFESKAFFTAPAGGKIGIVDLKADKVTGSIDVDGYVSDLVVDKDRGELLVADASGNRIVIFDAKNNTQVAQVSVPTMPWSIALSKGKLLVASMVGKKISVVDVATRKIVGAIDLPLGPQHVAVVGDQHPQIVVHLLPMVFDMKTQKEISADRLTYWPSVNYGPAPEKPEVDTLAKASAAFPKAKIKVYFNTSDRMAAILDVGPMHGRTRSGYAIKPVVTKVFVVEPGAKDITVFPVEGAKPGKIELGETISALELFDLRLYALCKDAKKIYEIDAQEDKVLRTLSLPYQAQEFYAGCLVGKHTTVEQFDAGEIIDGFLPGRLAVGFAPLTFDPETLAPGVASSLPFFPYDRRSRAAAPGAQGRQLFVDNLHTIGVETKAASPKDPPNVRWIDTSAVTNYHVNGNPALLMPGDAPGAVTFRIDDGPECDWENDVWFTPDQRAMLVRGTDEFDQWNAVRFALKPGKHVIRVKAYSPEANLEGLQIQRTLAGTIDARLRPLPQDVHGKVPLPSYGGVFTASEPVSFDLWLSNKSDRAQDLSGVWTVQDYAGKTVLEGKDSFAVGAGATSTHTMNLDIKGTGRFTVCLKVSSPQGELEVFHRFVRLPKLEYPRLLYRAEDTGQIKGRVAQYPQVYQRYRDWLRRQSDKPGFLPKTMRGGTGEGMPLENKKWRAIALQFADMFLEPAGAKKYESKLLPFLSWAGGTDAWQGDYEFAGAHTVLNDLMMSTTPAAAKNVDTQYRKDSGYISDSGVQGAVFTDYLLTLKEPLTPRDRAVVYRVAMELNNYDQYFGAHAGAHGGNWWHGTNAFCHCPIQSVTRTFLLCRNFFGEKEFFERNNISGILTFLSYVDPRYDTQKYLYHGSFRETTDPVNNAAAMRWALSGLSRKPLEKTYYTGVFDCIDKLNGPMADEIKEVDELLSKGANVVIPLYVALGWLDPGLKGVDWEEMPPSMIFNGEGVACMKSGWDKNMTDIYFTCGVKDTSYRVLPNHFTLFKAGQAVVGTFQTGDHGEPVPFYGNCVRVGEEEGFPDYLRRAGAYTRMEERFVTDVDSALGCSYMFRDWRMSTYRQEGAYWAGGGHEHAYPREVTLHSHSEHPYYQAGGILAYETSPAFDYVAGNATNDWPVADVKEAYRQLLYVRPDVLVIYDRLLLGDSPKSVKWPLMVLENKANQGAGGCGLKLDHAVFTGTDNIASMWGKALLPQGGTIGVMRGYIEIKPPVKQKQVEFFVVLRVGLAQPVPLECKLVQDAERSGIAFTYDDKDYTVAFNRQGAVGGHIQVEQAGKVSLDRPLAQEIQDTYENWKGTSQFNKWMHEDRFKAYMTESDRKRFGSAAE